MLHSIYCSSNCLLIVRHFLASSPHSSNVINYVVWETSYLVDTNIGRLNVRGKVDHDFLMQHVCFDMESLTVNEILMCKNVRRPLKKLKNIMFLPDEKSHGMKVSSQHEIQLLIQWNLSITTTSIVKFIPCDLTSNVFKWGLKVPIYSC